MQHAAAAEQVTQQELQVIHALRALCRSGYGTLEVKVRNNEIQTCIKHEAVKVAVDAA
jgi:hypothetical protein